MNENIKEAINKLESMKEKMEEVAELYDELVKNTDYSNDYIEQELNIAYPHSLIGQIDGMLRKVWDDEKDERESE